MTTRAQLMRLAADLEELAGLVRGAAGGDADARRDLRWWTAGDGLIEAPSVCCPAWPDFDSEEGR